VCHEVEVIIYEQKNQIGKLTPNNNKTK